MATRMARTTRTKAVEETVVKQKARTKVTVLNAATLRAARDRVNAEGLLRKLGTCDAELGVRAGSRGYIVSFAAFSCAGVQAANKAALAQADCVIDMPAETWSKYLGAMGTKRETSLVALDLKQNILTATDPVKAIAFPRYHLTFDTFFRALAGAA